MWVHLNDCTRNHPEIANCWTKYNLFCLRFLISFGKLDGTKGYVNVCWCVIIGDLLHPIWQFLRPHKFKTTCNGWWPLESIVRKGLCLEWLFHYGEKVVPGDTLSCLVTGSYRMRMSAHLRTQSHKPTSVELVMTCGCVKDAYICW